MKSIDKIRFKAGSATLHPQSQLKKNTGMPGCKPIGLPAVETRCSPIHGSGLFAGKNLPPRRKLGELSGRLVKMPGARKAIELLPVIYHVELNQRYALDCSEGNEFKHLNHSCDPNCYLRIYRNSVEVYTLKTIKRGTELTVDYGTTPHKHRMKCFCGAAKCRNWI